MVIHGITVCVDYACLLQKGIEKWLAGLDALLVVTSLADETTRRLCDMYGISTFTTDIFYRNGAAFNKGAAIARAYDMLTLGVFQKEKTDHWALFFDADMEPPVNWLDVVRAASPSCGTLYGARRCLPDGSSIADEDIAGFFHLACMDDPRMQVFPIVDTHWFHAGNYDSTFQDRWPKELRVCLPLTLIHHGEPGKNWCGVGRQAEVARIHRERRRRGGQWQHETVESRNHQRMNERGSKS